jgi:outer membrane autotransporter protein
MPPLSRRSAALAAAVLPPLSIIAEAHADTVILAGQSVTRATAADIGGLLQFGPGSGAATLVMQALAGTQRYTGRWSVFGSTNALFNIGSGTTLELAPSAVSLSAGAPLIFAEGGGQLTLGAGSFLGTAPRGLGISGGSTLEVADAAWLNGASKILISSAGGGTLRYSGTGDATFSGVLFTNSPVGVDTTIEVAAGAGTLALKGAFGGSGANLNIRGNGSGGTLVDLGFTSGNYLGKLKLSQALVQIENERAIGAGGIEAESSTIQLVSALSLAASQPLSVTNNLALINFSGGSTVGFSVEGAITGNGFSSIAALDGVRLTFSGDSSATFAGAVDVEQASSLTLDGARLDLATIRSASAGAGLFGAGTVGAIGTAGQAFAGTVEPSLPGASSFGTLTVVGDANLGSATSVLRTQLLANTGDADLLSVGGAANIAGATLALVYDPAISGGTLVPPPGILDQYLVLDAGSITGNFGAAQLVLVDPVTGFQTVQTLSVSGTNRAIGTEITLAAAGGQYLVSLFTPAPLAPGVTNTGGPVSVQTPGGTVVVNPGVGTVTNTQINTSVTNLQTAVAPGSGATTDAQYVASALFNLPAAVLPGAVVAAGVSANPNALPDVTIDSMTQAGNVAMKRLMQLRDGVLGAAAAKTGGDAGAVNYGDFGAALNGPTPADGVRGWMRGYGFWEQVDAQSDAQGEYSAAMGGALVGGDVALDGGLLAGAFVGYAPGNLTVDTVMGQEQDSMDGVNFGVYGSWVPGGGAAYVQAVAMGGYTSVDRTRSLLIPGVVRTATSSSDVWGMNIGGEAGLNLSMGSDTWLQPYLGLNYGYVWRGGYTEQGAGSVNLTDGSQVANELQPTAGARFLHSYRMSGGVLSPFVGAAFLAQVPLGDWSTTATNAFDAGNVFTFEEGPNDRYGATFEAGIEWANLQGMTVYASFNGMAAGGKERFGGQVGVIVPF